jgi:hypothetical protein
MRGTVILAWIGAIWIAAGIEAASGLGVPGPLYCIAIAAGLAAGPYLGVGVGVVAGICAAILSGLSIAAVVPLFLLGALGASLLGQWLSPRHLLVGMLAAIVGCVFVSVILGLLSSPTPATMGLMLSRGFLQAWWMIPIYGIVLIGSSPRSIS